MSNCKIIAIANQKGGTQGGKFNFAATNQPD